jgi:hypothetical protein
MVVINNPTPGRAMLALETKTATTLTLETSTNMSLEIVQMVPSNVKTENHVVRRSGKEYNVTTTSNSTIDNFAFYKGTISFDADGQIGSRGFTYIVIPKKLVDNVTEIYVDDTPVKFVFDENLTHTFCYFIYEHSAKVLVVPEFPTLLMVSMLMIVSSIVVITKKLKNKKT